MNRAALLACVLLFTACSGVRLAGAPTRACAAGAPLIVSTTPKWAAHDVALYTADLPLANDAALAAAAWNGTYVGAPIVHVVNDTAKPGESTITGEPFTSDDFAGETETIVDHETITGARVRINATDWKVRLDRVAILEHEIGHVLGLPVTHDPADVMFCDVAIGARVGPGDVAALRRLYGGG